MSPAEMDAFCRIGRRQFVQLYASSLAFAAAGCGRRGDHARGKYSTITVLNENDERDLGPEYDNPPKLLVFLPLVTWNAKGELEARLAQSWQHSPDYRTWTVHLRNDLRWHDGAPVTAHDVKFTMDLYMHPAVLWVPPGAYAVTVLDDRTYTVTYHRRVIGSRSPGATITTRSTTLNTCSKSSIRSSSIAGSFGCTLWVTAHIAMFVTCPRP